MSDNIDTFWSEYTDFDNKNGHFYGGDSIWKVNISKKGISICGIRIIRYRVKRCLVFVACRLTSKSIVISSVEKYWGDVKTIKSGKYQLSVVTYKRNRALYIHLPIFNFL